MKRQPILDNFLIHASLLTVQNPAKQRKSEMKQIEILMDAVNKAGNFSAARALLEDLLVGGECTAALFDKLAMLYESDKKNHLALAALRDAQNLEPSKERFVRIAAMAKRLGIETAIKKPFSAPTWQPKSQIGLAITSIIITTYHRIWSLERCLNSIKRNTHSRNAELVIIIDNNDIETRDWCFAYDFEGFTRKIHLNREKLEWVKATNRGISMANHDHIVFLNDDMETGAGWLERAITLHSIYFPDRCGLLSFRDDFVNGRICCAGMTTKNFIREYLDNRMLNESYIHYCADDELTEIAIGLGRYRYCDSCHVPHHHRTTKTGKVDDVVKGSLQVRDHDIAVLETRRQMNYERNDLAWLPKNPAQWLEGLKNIDLTSIQSFNVEEEFRSIFAGRTVAIAGAGCDYSKINNFVHSCALCVEIFDLDPVGCWAAKQGLKVCHQNELYAAKHDVVFVPSLQSGRQIGVNLKKRGISNIRLLEDCVPQGLLKDKARLSVILRMAGNMPDTRVNLAPLRSSRLDFIKQPRLGWTRSFAARDKDLISGIQKTIDSDIAQVCAEVRKAGGRVTTWRGDFSSVNPSGEKTKRWENSWILGNIAIMPNMRVLDIGGASSQFSYYLAANACEVDVVDIDYLGIGVIENARNVASEMDWNMRVLNWNAANGLPYENDSFDAVFCICVMEHLLAVERRFISREIGRVLAPGGYAGFTVDFLAKRKSPEGKGLRFNTWDQIERDVIVPSKLSGPPDPPRDDAGGDYFVGAFMLKKRSA